jgi:hypothetical protein
MMTARCFLLAVLFLTSALALAQQPNLAPNAPKDKPVDAVGSEEVRRMEEAIKPYVEKAKATFPQAKARFIAGLPPKHSFFVTTRLRDSSGRFEQVFIAVKEIKDGKITGLIWSEITVVSGYRFRDSYTFPESELVDWTITRPDGTEEGNFVGNFLDTYQPTRTFHDPVEWNRIPATPGRMTDRLQDAAIRYQSAGPIPRVVFFDIGYPFNEQENKALDRHALILVTAVAQDQKELPLGRVYVLVDGREVELKRLRQTLTIETNSSSQISKTFGPYRADELFLLPMYLRLKTGDLMVEFAVKRERMKVGVFGTPVLPEVGKLDFAVPSGAGPAPDALKAFIKREFPGLDNK